MNSGFAYYSNTTHIWLMNISDVIEEKNLILL